MLTRRSVLQTALAPVAANFGSSRADDNIKKQVWVLDTDLGADDALGLLIFSRLVGGEKVLLSCFGNVNEARAYRNIDLLRKIYRLNAKLYRGAARPIGKFIGDATHVHGIDGLGGAALELERSLGAASGADGTMATLVGEQGLQPDDLIRWITFGPATNLANLKRDNPALFDRVDQITIMTGVFFDRGNATSYAEFNAIADAQALSEVLSANKRLNIVPLDMCRKVQFRLNEIVNFLADEDPVVRAVLTTAQEGYCAYNLTSEGFLGCFPHDSLAVLVAVYPERFYALTGSASCDLAGAALGKTRFVAREDGPHRVFTGGDLKFARETILRVGRATSGQIAQAGGGFAPA